MNIENKDRTPFAPKTRLLRRPVVACGVFFCLGIFLASESPATGYSQKAIPCGIAFTCLLFLFLQKKPERKTFFRCLSLLICCLLLGAGVLLYRVVVLATPLVKDIEKQTTAYVSDCKSASQLPSQADLPLPDNKRLLASGAAFSQDISGEILTVSAKDKNVRLLVLLKDRTRLQLTVFDAKKTDFQPGEQITAPTELSLPAAAGNFGAFDYRKYLLSKNIRLVGSTPKAAITVIGVSNRLPSRLRRGCFLLRTSFLQGIRPYITKSGLSLTEGMLFGDKSDMEESLYESFQQNGTAHILAVSGLHIGIIYALLLRLFTRLFQLTDGLLGNRKSKAASICVAIALFFYAALADFSPSVVRAVLMIDLHLLSMQLRLKYDLLSAASVSAVLLLFVTPYALFSAGFQLSYLAVFTIGLWFPRISASTMPVFFKNTLLPILWIQLGLLPYTVYNFQYLSFVSVVANIPILFLAGICVPIGVISLALTSLFPSLFHVAGSLLSVATGLLHQTNNLFYFGGHSSIPVTAPPIAIVLLFYAGFFFGGSDLFRILLRRKERRKQCIAGILCLVLVALGSAAVPLTTQKAQVVFLDVGQGSCIQIRTPKGRNLLIDGGGRPTGNIGKSVLKPYLLKNGVRKVDVAIATHKDSDHYKGLCELQELGMIDQLVTNDEGFQSGDILLEEKDFRIEVLAPQQKTASDNLSESSAQGTSEENESSLVLKICFKYFSVLATGDIGKETEQKLIATHGKKLRADILAVPHHGSNNSSSEDFLEAVHPSLAVIQVGKNTYGHPSTETLQTFREKSIPVVRTDLDGALAIFQKKNDIRFLNKSRCR